MIVEVPNFIDSPYLIIDERGWRLKDDAPTEVISQFKDFIELIESYVK